MAKIAIPPDLAGMFAACEDAYEQATREGYAENPAVIAAVTALKSAWKALLVANYNLMTAKGFFPVEFATMRTDRAWGNSQGMHQPPRGNRASSAGTSSVQSVLDTRSLARITAAGSGRELTMIVGGAIAV
jgi:hypothetical protein